VTVDGTLEARGLTSAEAAERLVSHGPNRAPRPRPRSLASRVLAQLSDPMILLLLAALVVVTALGDVVDGAIIAGVVVLNTVIGVVQEVRAANALEALDRLSAPHATVIRDGRLERVDAADVVPGDVVRLEAGDVLPADGELVESVGLQLDEAAMTGESVPVGRGVGDQVLGGTVVTRGRGFAAVQHTGADSGLGRIAAAVSVGTLRPTPLQRRLARLSRQLVLVTLVLASLVFVLGWARGERPVDMLILAVSLAVAAIPESLPAVVSVALALGAFRMARHSAIVRWLPAVETLGSVTVLASDKTGTLTEGRMVVQRVWTGAGVWQVTGHGYAADGALVGPADDQGSLDALMRAVALCNDAHLRGPQDGTWDIIGDPMEGALLVAAVKHEPEALSRAASWRRVEEVPFDSTRQRMITLHTSGAGWLAVCKGAPEVVLGLVADRTEAARAETQAHELATRGFRVLAVADRLRTSRPVAGELEQGLELRGLVALADPARPDAPQVIRDCHDAGIRTILITGDHPATARAIAEQLDISSGPAEIGDGDSLAHGGDLDRVHTISVYARTRPEQKVDIVTALQARGEVVAMTGDGVNDAPALRRADIGVAMGDRGTEVARQASDLVLADDNLRTLLVAVGEGRRIYTNIRTFLRYGLAGGLAEVLVILVGPFLGMALPLGPGQILWINMLTHGVPGVAFGGEPMDPADMRRPSPDPERSVLGGGLPRQIAATGLMITVVTLVAGALALRDGHLQTWVFLTLGLAQLGVALALRSPRAGLGWRSRGLEAAVAVSAVLQVLAVLWGPLQSLLGTQAVAATDLALLLGLSALPGLALAGARRRTTSRVGADSETRKA
jgi:P-type Ca2+ transporter type 2C